MYAHCPTESKTGRLQGLSRDDNLGGPGLLCAVVYVDLTPLELCGELGLTHNEPIDQQCANLFVVETAQSFAGFHGGDYVG